MDISGPPTTRGAKAAGKARRRQGGRWRPAAARRRRARVATPRACTNRSNAISANSRRRSSRRSWRRARAASEGDDDRESMMVRNGTMPMGRPHDANGVPQGRGAAYASRRRRPCRVPNPRAKVAQKRRASRGGATHAAAGVDATAAAEFARSPSRTRRTNRACGNRRVTSPGARPIPASDGVDGCRIAPPRDSRRGDASARHTRREGEGKGERHGEGRSSFPLALSSSSSSSSLIVAGSARTILSLRPVVFDGQHEVNRTVNTSASASLPRVSRLSPRSTRRVATRGRERSADGWRIRVPSKSSSPPSIHARREN